MRANSPLDPSELLISVPYNLFFHSALIDNSPISHIIQGHPSVFIESDDFEDWKMIAYMIYILTEGPTHYWHEYLTLITPDPESLLHWTQSELEELQDPDIIYDTSQRLKQLERHY